MPPVDPTLAVAVIVFVLTNLVKDLVEAVIPPKNPLHDSALRALPIAMACVGKVVGYLLATGHPNWAGIEAALVSGVMAGGFAIGVWHTAKRQAPTPVPPDAPAIIVPGA